MRIVVDVTPLLLRSAGVKNYIYHWLRALERLESGDSIGIFPYLRGLGPLDHEHSMAGQLATVAGLASLHAVNRSRLPWFAPGVDVFHASHHLHNPPRRTRLTSTIHDMTCWLMPELHSKANVAATRWFGEHIMARAAGLIAVSESTRRDALDILDLDPGRVTMIYPGVADAFFEVTAEEALAARQKLGLEKPYALYVGTIEPRKNVPRLLDAWAAVRPELRDEYELVVAGPVGWADRATVARLRAGGEGVRYVGYVAEADLPGLTAGAALMAYPSLYEGFGFPVAEAMAAGVPVLTSDVSSLPEIAGEAALLVDPESLEEICAGLERLLASPSLRERLGGAGRKRAREFRWAVTARRSLEWFRRIAGGN
jgi:glycosyltransferase involved in cell wall biosynthesis